MIAATSRRLALVCAGGLLLALAAVVPAAAATCAADAPPGDINGDGYADVVVGAPGRNQAAGAIRVLYGTPDGLTAKATGTALDDQLITQDTAGISGAAEPGDEFGTAVVVGRFGGSSCWDVAVGAPGENADSGAVTILLGSPSGLTGTGSRVVTQNSGGIPGTSEAGDRFGAALARGDVYGEGKAELLVGAPGEAVGAGNDEGAVWVLAGDGTNFGGVSTKAVMIHQDSPGVPGAPESGDRFGAALVAADPSVGHGAFAVGAPGENNRAGNVTVFQGGFDPADSLGPVTSFGQGASGVPGVSKSDERFGASLAASYSGGFSGGLAIGAPGDNQGRGSVTVLYGLPRDAGRPAPRVFVQGSNGVPGSAERSEEFGASLAFGLLDAGATPDLAIGAPGDRVGSADRASGSVTVLFGADGVHSGAGGVVVHQDTTDVEGTAESLDAFGASVAALRIRGAGVESLVVGVPAELLGDELGGVFHAFAPGDAGPVGAGSQMWSAESPDVLGGPQDDERLGASLGGGLT